MTGRIIGFHDFNSGDKHEAQIRIFHVSNSDDEHSLLELRFVNATDPGITEIPFRFDAPAAHELGEELIAVCSRIHSLAEKEK